MNRGVYIIGTGTGVGKTVMSGAVVAALRDRGVDAGYLKPVGTEGLMVEGRLINPDALWVKEVAGLDDPPDLLNPFCLRLPLCPLAAGREEGLELGLDEICEKLQAALDRHGFTVVEGVGGLLAPLNEEHTFIDLMLRLPLPVVITALPGLGTINHTVLTIEALRRTRLELTGFCFCGAGEEDHEVVASNQQIITQFSGARFLGSLPRLSQPVAGPELLQAARDALRLSSWLPLA